MKAISRGFVTGLSVLLTLGMVGGIAAVALFYYFAQDLPDYTKLSQYQPATTTRLYTADGQLMTEYAVEKRLFLPLEKIPRRVVQAFLAAEDKNFYHHTGIDAYGILRAALENFQHIGQNRSLVGGSTITQQIVKNFLLTNEKSFTRKIKEAILAFRISKIYSKDKILELYLNEIYLGLGTYGVAAAAQEYFGKPLAALDTEEIALLAAMPKAPANYDPRRHPARALERRNYVIQRMLEDGYLNPAEADRASAAPITLGKREQEMVAAPSFAEEVRRWLVERFDTDAVYKGGLFVETTLDPTLQRIAGQALRNSLIAYDKRHGYRGPLTHLEALEGWPEALTAAAEGIPVYDTQRLAVVLGVKQTFAEIGFADRSKGTLPLREMEWARPVLKSGRLGRVPGKPADILTPGNIILVEPTGKKKGLYALLQIPRINGGIVVMDPQTGKVLAMSGGYNPKTSEFNRATQARRQPGSAFKPFVYLSALEHGFTPSTIVVDEPVELYQGPGLPMWRPRNYGGDFIGPATLRMGLEKSRNVMTVRLAQMLGIQRIAGVAERFGIYSEPPANYSMVLGALETTLLQMVNAYGAIVNGGMKVQPQLIERIADREGRTIYRRDTRACKDCVLEPGRRFSSYTPPVPEDERERILDPRIAYQVTSMLQGVVQRGTAVRAARLGKPLAGKTGTTNDSRDAWFVGFSPDLVVGVYTGFDQPRSLGRKETGGRVALPAFIEVMEHVPEHYTSRPFYVPKGIQHMRVNRYTGLPPYPGEPVGETIVEAFLYGGSVFVPGDELDIEGDYAEEAPGYAPYNTYNGYYREGTYGETIAPGAHGGYQNTPEDPNTYQQPYRNSYQERSTYQPAKPGPSSARRPQGRPRGAYGYRPKNRSRSGTNAGNDAGVVGTGTIY